MLTWLRYRERHGDETGLDRAEEADDVLQPLRRQDRRPVTWRPELHELSGDHVHPVTKLRPSEALGHPGRVGFVVDERIGDVVGLLLCPLCEHCRDEEFGLRHHVIPFPGSCQFPYTAPSSQLGRRLNAVEQ